MPDYGQDTWCEGDFRPDMPLVSGRKLLAQALRNRLETAEGTLAWMGIEGSENFGYDLRALVNTKQRDLRGITGRIVSEVQKDDRVDSATCTAEWTEENAILIDIEVDDGDGPFPFTLLVTSLTVELLTKAA